jgi:hypothetical protein
LRNKKALRAFAFLLGGLGGVTLATTSSLKLDAFQHQRQLRGVDLHVRRARVRDGEQLKGPRLQPLFYDTKAVSIPENHLHDVTPPIEENE